MRPSRRLSLIAFTSLTLLFAATLPAAAVEPLEPEASGDSWIVTLAPGVGADRAHELSRVAGGRAELVYRHALIGFQFRGSAAAAAALQRNPNVASVQVDGPLSLAETLPNGVKRVMAYRTGGVVGAYQAGFRGNGARIAVLDTGIDLDHPELVASIDGPLSKNCVSTSSPPNDGHGHGTHVSGTAAAPLNGVGVVGVAPQARLVAVKMFSDAGQSSEALALCALDHIVGLNFDADPANDVDVANMSWGEQRTWGDCASDALHGAICAAHAAGIILVAGAGNSGANGGNFVPAAYPEVIGVSALADFDGLAGGAAGCGWVSDLFAQECDDTFAFFSNHGATVDVIAPGVMINSTWVGGGTKTSSGTSMATPHVSGVAALMAAASPGLTPEAAHALLLTSGECPNGQAADADGSAGCAGQGTWKDDPDGIPEPLVHALRAAQAAGAPPPPPPDPVAPTAPTLTSTGTPGSVDLTWTVPASDGGSAITSYNVYRGAASDAVTEAVASVSVLDWSDTAVLPGETWWYEVAAVNDVGEGPRSNTVSQTVPQPPPPADPPSAPTLSASAGNAVVNLSWTAPSSDGGAAITAYEIYRGTSSGSASLVATVGNVLAYQDTGRTNGTTYWYEVAAVNSAGPGARSNEVSATPKAPATAPSPPRSLKSQKVEGGIKLTWQPPTSDGGSAIIGYYVYRTGGSGNALRFTVYAPNLTMTDTLVARRTWYSYVVTAVNSVGESQASNITYIKSP